MKRLLLILLCLPLLVFSQDEKRLALVIGNANYVKGPLANPVNDALLIAKTLEELDFDVILDTNLADKRSFKETIREFGNKRPDYDVAFVYYAGHGIQVGSENYLLPTNEVFESEYDVQDYGVSVQDIIRYLTGMSNQVNVLILDACRDNPFEGAWKKTRSLKGGGLAKIPPPTGSLIAFSTDAGMTAADGDGKNSIYCKSLSENLLKEDIGLEQVFKNVRSEVLRLSNNQQSPVESSKLTGTTFYLKKNFSVYNSTIQEIFEVSNDYLKAKEYYKSIEILNEAANFEKKRGNIGNEIKYRYSIIDIYFNKFRNSDTELHFFTLINSASQIDRLQLDKVNDYFDTKSYKIFFDNLLYFSLSFDDSNQNISLESIYNFLVYVRYVAMIPVNNYGLDLSLTFHGHSIDDYDRLIDGLKNKINDKKYKFSAITNFWSFRVKYSTLRLHNDLKGINHNSKLDAVNDEDIYEKCFADFYQFLKDCNVQKERDLNSLSGISFEESNFHEKEIYDQIIKRYNSVENAINLMVTDIVGYIDNGNTKQNIEFYKLVTGDYFKKINEGFNLDSDIFHGNLPWVLFTLSQMTQYDILFNGYNSSEATTLNDFYHSMINYLNEYKEALLIAKNTNNQNDLIKFSNFNLESQFDLSGYYGYEAYVFANENGLKTDYSTILDTIFSRLDFRITVLSNESEELNSSNKKQEDNWVREIFEPTDARHNLHVLENSDFQKLSNKRIKNDILFLEKQSKLSEIIENDLLGLLDLIESINVSGNSNGELRHFYFWSWYPFVRELSEISSFSEQDHLVVLDVLNKLRVKFSSVSPNFVWDLEELVDTYEEMLKITSNSDNYLLAFSIKKSVRQFLVDAKQIYNYEKLDPDLITVVESQLTRLNTLLK